MWNFIMNMPQTLILIKIASVILAVQNSWREQSLMVPMTTSSNYFCMATKMTEAILNKIKVCGIFIIKFRIEIHLLKDDSRYLENK